MRALASKYNPSEIESIWYQHWLENNMYAADPAKGGRSYTILMPPPNITGILHMGHALNVTIQDILIRWKRMAGFNALWIPGTDHAGIATQNVVERALGKEGKTRNDLGREMFVKRVWEWREQYGNTIIQQLKKLGVSCDWSRLRFTMDEGLSDAVAEVFVRLYEKKLIYRGNYIINWCPRCHTALSDEESIHADTRGKLYYIRYPLKEKKNRCPSRSVATDLQAAQPVRGAAGPPSDSGALVVATTRPETLLGDMAVAVNPKDKRYQELIGLKLILPVLEREIPVIADDFVDPEFGTGAVKVTPAHDPNDFLIGQRHNLKPVNVMHADGRMNENAGPYAGQDRFECRRQIVEFLEKNGLLEKVVDHTHAVGHCYRCDTVIEPRLSLQWFVKMKPLAQPAIAAVKAGKIKFIPERWTKVYLDWMENIRDWCISRQIWWGHRIPVFYCDDCGEVWAAKTVPLECRKCKGSKIKQDEDVLDTWFSSWLWPFSTMNWPRGGEDLKFYYPTDTLVTGSEIIFFWVARMIMAGFEFMGELPFRTVYIHGTVRDNRGRKMSKSLGNSIDPQDIIGNFSADALRFSLIMLTATGQDVYLSDDKFEIGRNFLTKLWNAARFIQMNGRQIHENNKGAAGAEALALPFLIDSEKGRAAASLPRRFALSHDEQFILARLNETISACSENLEQYRFNDYAKCLYEFVWHQFCDWHIEYVKMPLNSADPPRRKQALQVLHHVFERLLRLLHPLTPFITEELWHAFGYGAEDETIQLAEWPQPCGKDKLSQYGIKDEAVAYVENKHELIRICRGLRQDCDIPASARIAYSIKPADEKSAKLLAADRDSIAFLLRAEAFNIEHERPRKKSVNAICRLGTVYIPIEGLVDVTREIKKLNGQVEELAQELKRVEAKLNNADFAGKAPPEVVAVQKEKKQHTLEQIEKLRHIISALEDTGA
jgi:valyl-tRNA synthetase